MKGHRMPCLPIFLSILLLPLLEAHREHKVHNIVLYPEKNSWCKTFPIKQIIGYPGYKSEEIDNNVCVGACFSYSIPHTEPEEPGEVIVPYCDSCQPSEKTWQNVQLESTNDLKSPPLVKRVQIITNCTCTPCDNGSRFGHLDNDDDMHDSHDDIPDLIDLMNIRNETNEIPKNSENLKTMLNHKLVVLLQNIQEKNSQYDKAQLIELLKMIQGPDDKLSDKKIEEFVESFNSGPVALDIPRLKEVLTKFEKSKLFEKHRKFGLGASTTESSSFNDDQNEGEDVESSDEEDEVDELTTTTTTVLPPHHHHHHHHVGEIVSGHGHLKKGPHGSLVIEPEHEKLDVNPHELKPNHAGTMLSYASHSEEKSKPIDD